MEDNLVKVSISRILPYIDYTMQNNSTFITGVLGEMWTTLEGRLGLRSEYVIEDFKDGIINFRNLERDVLLHPFIPTPADPRCELSFPVMDVWYDVYLESTPEINSSSAFITCWSTKLWVGTILLVLIIVTVLYLMLRLTSKYIKSEGFVVPSYEPTDSLVQLHSFGNKYNLSKQWRLRVYPHRKLQIENERSMSSCFMFVVAAISSQDNSLRTEVFSVRLLIFVFLFFALIMCNAYSGLLISQLTLGAGFLPFNSLEEMLHMKEPYSLCVRPHAYPYLQLLGNDSSGAHNKWKTILNGEFCPENDNINWSHAMCESRAAFLEIPALIERQIKNAQCKIAKLSKKYYTVSISLLINSGGFQTSIQCRIREELLKYREAGILSRFQHLWIGEDKPLKLDATHMRRYLPRGYPTFYLLFLVPHFKLAHS
ncbi:hypothetical protein RUM44_011083 [Polyplax serrata]|uniref:Ionotropic glutamate receptor C-terminal domain-containing protein n=1 Tax=Polyplax serrata TaxID=468196 RepID=A0ABR1APB8_POLSC